MKQSQKFDVKSSTPGIVKVAVVGSILATMAFATTTTAPVWYTDLTTQLTSIAGYVLAVLGSVISIRLAPLAWDKIKMVLNR